MNRSFRAHESQMQASVQRRQPQGTRNQNGATTIKDKEEELALFLEMRKREKERNDLLLHTSEEFDAPLGSKPGSSPIFKIVQSAPTRKTSTDDFLNSDNDKNDYDWLLTPPGTPLFPSLEMESQKTVMSQIGTPNSRRTALKSRLANSPAESGARSNLASRQSTLSPGLNSSSAGIRRPSSSGGSGSTASRPATPTGRPTLTTTAKSSRPSTPTSRVSRSAVPPARPSIPSARSSTPTARPTLPSSKSTLPASKSSISTSRSTSRSATPTRRLATPSGVSNGSGPPGRASSGVSNGSGPLGRASSGVSNVSGPPGRSSSGASNVSGPPGRSSSVAKSGPTATKSSVPSRGSSPTVKSRPWKPSEMPGFSLDAPPNLRTSMPERPLSASRGRPGAPSARSASVEPVPNGRPRRQSCSPSRGRAPNGSVHSSGSSVPAVSRARLSGNDNVSPVMIGTKMVERVVNMRKLAPPKHDDQRSSQGNPAGKSSSSDTSGFGRNLSKKSLDMALRHMDIRRSVPGSLRPLMTNIPASSLYSVRSGPARSRTVSVSDSPLATSSNASSEQSVNNTLCLDGSEVEDNDLCSERGGRSLDSPASHCGR